MATTVIVGGVAGGMSTAARLRRNDEHREIIVFEASGYVSFANCGLPYHVGGVIEKRSALLLQTPESLGARFGIDVRTRHRVTDIDPDAKTVTVHNLADDTTFTQAYDELVLSPGAKPFIPPIDGIERALTLRTVEDVDTIIAALEGARSVALIGGGFIGLEMAENLRHRDLQVTVIERAPQILAPFDEEMAAIVAKHLKKNGVDLRLNANTTSIGANTVTLESGEEIPADVVVAAIGVRPDTTLAQAAGLTLSEGGGIAVDEYQRTSNPHIFALGDAAEKVDHNSGASSLVPLAQTANRHGRLVADVISGRDLKALPVLGTAIVGLFGMQAAAVGWNERVARNTAKNIRVVHVHPANHAGYYPGASQLNLKLVIDADTDLILGAQAVGMEGADKRIDVIATAMRGGLTASDLVDLELAYAPQFGSAKDPVNIAGMVADNMARGEKTVQWNEVTELLNNGAQLVDVRTPGECAQGSIPGAINIPVDELRARIGEINKAKPVIVSCQVGLRGHVALRTLAQHGFDVANLDGGYLTWSHGQLARAYASKD